MLLIQWHYPVSIVVCPQTSSNYLIIHRTSESLASPSDIYNVSLTYLFISGSDSRSTDSFHFAVLIGFAVHPRGPRLQPARPPACLARGMKPVTF